MSNKSNDELQVLSDTTKLDQSVVLYMPASDIGRAAGARCGSCWKFVTSGACLEVEGDIKCEDYHCPGRCETVKNTPEPIEAGGCCNAYERG